LKVALPLIKLLRACDNLAKEVMGKVYHLMFEAGEHLKEMQGTVLWAREAALFHEERWEYLHFRMHAAGYALDPEFLYNGDGGALDQATTPGLVEVVERLSLRALIKAAVDPVDAASRLTLSSAQVRKHAATCMTQFAGFRAKEENLTLPLVVDCAQQMAPSRWWNKFCSHSPELQVITCSVLMQPVSASASATGQFTARLSRLCAIACNMTWLIKECTAMRHYTISQSCRMPAIAWLLMIGLSWSLMRAVIQMMMQKQYANDDAI
jgi:hypothetical protein